MKTRKIKLHNSKLVVLVDEIDYEFLNTFKWSLDTHGYARTSKYSSERKNNIFTSMHSLILECPKGFRCDHINGNILDNRRKNLRICTHAQNKQNAGPHRDNTSGYKGVRKHRNNWQARICTDGENIHIGTFATPVLAALAYNKAAKEYHGDFARPNKI